MSQITSPAATAADRSLEIPSFFGPNLHPAVARLVGGRRGMVDGALPPALFVATSALAGTVVSRPTAIGTAVAVAAGTAVGLGIWRLLQRQPLKQVVRGFVGLTVAVVFVLLSGEARAFFLPGLWVDAAYAALFAASVAVGRPLAGVVYAALFQTGPAWRLDRRLRRVFAAASLGWSAVYAVRAGTQWVLYREDAPVLMAIAKVSLGWPLTVVAVAATLAVVRRAVRTRPTDAAAS
ncbi:DUF3159 domain-containing protein [Nocardioides caldifontis]|uniref:DUF3159 domain-containing protein n=1 Tax=Nocardioides caldifontis TaxID=2588938 RepID=UPI0011E0667E|nr:DUF3159 domain-containing protein [Nocardioides caldifontis]